MKKALLFIGILLAVVIVAGGGVLLYFSMDSSGNLKTFSVRYGSREFIGQSNEVVLAPGVTHVFECKTLFQSDGFTVKVTPAPGADAEYTVDGKPYAFRAAPELTDGFPIVLNTNSFALNIPSSTTLQSVLEKVYKDKTVIAPAISGGKNYFRLVVTSGDAQKTVCIDFRWEVKT